MDMNMKISRCLNVQYDVKDVSARERSAGSKLQVFEVSDRQAGSASPTRGSAKKYSRIKVDRPAT